ncbi:MAG: hypothetical protein PHW95_00870 [Patescibacteria group bacterium]|nr:hypothetical protein [Patescibacteria group bacterium]
MMTRLSHETGYGSEQEKKPETQVDLYLMRHSNRFAGKGEWEDPNTGEKIVFDDTENLTPEGKLRAREFGQLIGHGHDHIVSIGSMEARAAETGADIEAGAEEPINIRDQDGGRVVNQARGITYREFGSETQGVLKNIKPMINEQAGQHPQYGILPPEERASVRQEAQEVGLREAMKDSGIVEEAAEGVAYNLYTLREIAKDVKPDLKPALPLVSHGIYNESFLKKALIIENSDGTHQAGFEDVDEIGGFFAPAEAFKIRIIRDANGHERYECEFTDPKRQELFRDKQLSVDWTIIEELFHRYDERLAQREGRQPHWPKVEKAN